MKLYFPLFLLIVVLFSACADKAPQAPFAKESPQYAFLKLLSDSLSIKSMDPDKAVAIITAKSFKIYSYDILPGIYARFNRYKSNLDRLPVEQLKNTITQSAQSEAEKKMLLDIATKEGVVVADSAVNAQLEQIYSGRGGRENFQKFVEQQGFSLAYVEKDVRTQMTIQKYIDEKLEPSIQVLDADLQNAYQQDKTATVRHILFMTQGKTDDQKKEVRTQAETVLKQAREGQDFAQLAAEYSEDPGSKNTGGLYENFPRGRMVKAFEDASFNLPIGSISDLVETPYGYHIIKVEGREKETKPLEEVREQLDQQIKQSKRRDTYNALIEDLKNQNKYQEHFEVLS